MFIIVSCIIFIIHSVLFGYYLLGQVCTYTPTPHLFKYLLPQSIEGNIPCFFVVVIIDFCCCSCWWCGVLVFWGIFSI